MSHSCEPIDCPACEIPQMARNTLFDGKIMTAQDFLDEQNYFLGKHRRHNQYLHGWGTACGLKVHEHPNAGCHDRYVLVQPGAAVDCCGREILVRAPAMIDFREAFLAAWRQRHGPATPPDDQPHRLEIAIRYQECPADPVPAVFEGCGADASACLPGKLVDGYQFVALLDRPPQALSGGPQRITWDCTNNIDGAHRIALDAAHARLFVLTDTSPAMLVAIDTATKSIAASVSFAGFAGVDVAVARDGARLFVVLRPDGGGDPELRVLDAANLATPSANTVALAGAAAGEIRLLALRDGRLAAASPADDKLLIWGTDIAGAAPPAAATSIAIANGPSLLAQGPLGGYLYVAAANAAEVTAVKLSDLTTQLLSIGSSGTARPVALAVGVRDNLDLLAIADSVAGAVLLYETIPDAPLPADQIKAIGAPVTGLAGSPTGLAFSVGSLWLYAVSRLADGSGAVQAVSVERRAQALEPSIGAVAAAPRGSAEPVISGETMFLVFAGSPPAVIPHVPGGVAIFDIGGDDCSSLIGKVLDACPACEEGDEIVLATIVDYRWGDAITDARIDNRLGRRLLPSTSLLAEIIECLTHGSGHDGPPGRDGLDGKDGVDGQDGQNGEIGQDGANGQDGTNGQNGQDGKDGAGLRNDLPRVVGINWPHNKSIQIGSTAYRRLLVDGFVVAFDRAHPILSETLHTQSVQLLLQQPDTSPDDGQSGMVLQCYCNVLGIVAGVDVEAECDVSFTVPDQDAPGPATTGVRFRPVGRDGGRIELPAGVYRVVLEGDHILGEAETEIEDVDNPGAMIKIRPALDANHFAPGVSNGRCPTGDRVEGGRFLSWFTIERRG